MPSFWIVFGHSIFVCESENNSDERDSNPRRRQGSLGSLKISVITRQGTTSARSTGGSTPDWIGSSFASTNKFRNSTFTSGLIRALPWSNPFQKSDSRASSLP